MNICIPIISKNQVKLIEDIKKALAKNPDFIEWRVDYFEDVLELERVVEALNEVKKLMNQIPLIFTFRHEKEGGQVAVDNDYRLKLIKKVVEKKLANFIDIEMFNSSKYIADIKKITLENDCKLILSHHNFEKTPDKEFLFDKFLQGQDLGADISKIAVMPNNHSDVLEMFVAMDKAQKTLDIELIGISMGQEGKISRVIGDRYGSILTFASVGESSAPGQIDIDKIRTLIDNL